MKVLITGSGGIIGSSLVKSLTQLNDVDVIAPSRTGCDLRKLQEVEDVVSGIDAVVHAAGVVLGGRLQRMRKMDVLVDNVLMDATVLRAAVAAGVKKIIFISSMTAYPANTSLPLGEENLFDGPVEDRSRFYGSAKRLAPLMIESAREQYNIDATCVVFPNIYGPGDKFHHEYPPLVASVISQIDEAKNNNTPNVHGGDNGDYALDLLYVEDAVDLLKELLLKEERFQFPYVNAGSGKPSKIRDVYEAAKQAIGYEGEIIWEEGGVGSARYLKNDRVASVCSWFPQVELKDGIMKTVMWYYQTYDKEK